MICVDHAEFGSFTKYEVFPEILIDVAIAILRPFSRAVRTFVRIKVAFNPFNRRLGMKINDDFRLSH